jgi:predicted kinase
MPSRYLRGVDARKKVIVLVGLPGSGKSTWAARQGTGVLSSDATRALLAGDAQNQVVNRLVFPTLHYLLAMRVKAGMDATILDATSLTAKERRAWIRAAEALGCNAEAVFFDTPLAVCKSRNAARPRVVPEEVMERFALRLVPPSESEGFTKVTVVRP